MTWSLSAAVVMSVVWPRTAIAAGSVGFALAGVGGVVLVAAIVTLGGRIPTRSVEQTTDLYWSEPTSRVPALILWALIEGGGLIALVGYLLSEEAVAAAVACFATFALVMLRPSVLESRP